ncbi:AMP-dependent synthetase/ligase [Mycobacterium shigaense]|uniref:AMP-dependent synthetase/ligase n=1 Tax=Mycobacterium shigaense TaxID=722731 RepID=UPI002ADFE218|nr:long-chain fatty acid--CoA ligase [Mycobacterium shigaense]MEA1124593.1 long-chain fatty acid--CoA ligase [Mycobacterium shigaense]
MREFSIPAGFSIDERDTIVRSVYAHERDDPDHVIFERLVDGVWTGVTCAQAAESIRRTALGLIANGVNAGDRVAILAGTCYEWVILDYAILSVGALTVPIYDTSSAEQVRWILEDSGAVLVITHTDAHAHLVEQLSDELPNLRTILHLDDGAGRTALGELAEAGQTVGIGLLEDRLGRLRAADPATLIYTSGTTGRPKGCQLTHSNLLFETRGAAASFPTLLRKGERLLVFLPLAHVLARALSMSAFATKVTIGYTGDIKNLMPTLAVFKPTMLVSVPRVFEKVYNAAELNARENSRLAVFHIAARTAIEWSVAQTGGGPSALLRARHAFFDRLVYRKLRAALGGECRAAVSGGASLGTQLCHFYRGVGLTVYEGYGLTETSAAITINRIGDERVGTVGKLLPGNSMAVANDGEVLVRGGVVFNGYWHNEAATAEAIVHGWFHTGDLGSVDDDGFLSIIGRKKEIIVTAGGKNVAPTVLEDKMRTHPLISQAMVVGDNKPYVAALIAIDPEGFDVWKRQHGKTLSASVAELIDDPDLVSEVEQVVKEANQAVSHAESIRKFRILPVDFTVLTGELTPTLKVKRNVVATRFADDIAALYG